MNLVVNYVLVESTFVTELRWPVIEISVLKRLIKRMIRVCSFELVDQGVRDIYSCGARGKCLNNKR